MGLSPPTIETPHGWLVIYHCVKHTAAGCLYRLGLALFDLHAPERCLRRGVGVCARRTVGTARRCGQCGLSLRLYDCA
ncbi:MAG TPA: hypothetical protein VFZ34_32630 [Blastocatellia bacterium]|nr:hypothetical protein [Blastocatellia bacterium]